MNLFEAYNVQANGRKDAQAGVDSCDNVVATQLGARPVFDPARLDHARVHADLQLDGPIAVLEGDLHRLEDERTRYPSSLLMSAGLVAASAAEVLSCILLLSSLGVENPARVPVALMLAACIFWLTAQVARVTGRLRLVTVPAYAVLVCALAGARHADLADGTGIAVWAESLVLAAATIGPAWLAEWLWKHRAPGARLNREITNVRRRLNALTRRRDAAQDFVNQIETALRKWDDEATRIRAAYQKEHRRVTGRAPWPPGHAIGTN